LTLNEEETKKKHGMAKRHEKHHHDGDTKPAGATKERSNSHSTFNYLLGYLIFYLLFWLFCCSYLYPYQRARIAATELSEDTKKGHGYLFNYITTGHSMVDRTWFIDQV